MRYKILPATLQPPHLAASQEEEPPVVKPACFIFWTVGFCHEAAHFRFMGIEVCQPGAQGFVIVRAVHDPVIDQRQVALVVQQQVVAGHGAAREESTSHPIVGIIGIKLPDELPVAEEVNKKHPRWSEQVGDTCQQTLIILHVFKHFDRNHPVEIHVLVKTRVMLKIRNVCRYYGYILNTSGSALGLDEFSLGL